jgi:glycosyltransferase involved in cell wall biosynthesis
MSNFVPLKLVSIELSQPIPILPKYPDYERLYVVFWWHSIPLGHKEIAASQLPMSGEKLARIASQTIAPTVSDCLLGNVTPEAANKITQTPVLLTDFQRLIALEQPLNQLQQSISRYEDMSQVSVVICTRDRPEQLARCLQALQNSSLRPREIVVVDNAPTSNDTNLLVSQIPEVKYILEPRPGLDIARNTGIRHTTSEIIAFTDDDVAIHPDWIARIQQSFHDSQVMAVTGLIIAGELETEAQFLFEKYWSFNRGYRVLYYDKEYFDQHKPWGVPAWCVGAGANMAFRRQIFDLVGDFDERLDVGAAGCSGDSEFWYRVLAEGYTCRYEPTAVVFHYHRRHFDSLKQQIFYYMRGHVAALLIQFEKYKHWGNLRRLFISLPQWYSKESLKGLLKGFKGRYSTLDAEIAGCVSGAIYYLKHQKST